MWAWLPGAGQPRLMITDYGCQSCEHIRHIFKSLPYAMLSYVNSKPKYLMGIWKGATTQTHHQPDGYRLGPSDPQHLPFQYHIRLGQVPGEVGTRDDPQPGTGTAVDFDWQVLSSWLRALLEVFVCNQAFTHHQYPIHDPSSFTYSFL